jgi:hypothetical protein
MLQIMIPRPFHRDAGTIDWNLTVQPQFAHPTLKKLLGHTDDGRVNSPMTQAIKPSATLTGCVQACSLIGNPGRAYRCRGGNRVIHGTGCSSQQWPILSVDPAIRTCVVNFPFEGGIF